MESLTPDERMSITLNNVVKVLQSIFEIDDEITECTKFVQLCSGNMDKASLICEKIKKEFNVEVGFVDFQAIDTVKDLFQVIYEKSKSVKITYLAAERDIRRNDLLDIISKNKLTELDSSLSGAKGKLEESLTKIKDCCIPLNQLGHNVKYEWLKRIVDTVDPKVSRDELIKVVTAVDGNAKEGFTNISEAIKATNGCIDAISKLMLLIIQIENDLYSTADETSNGISAISEELLREGINVEGLSHIAEREREKRLRIQAKMRDFKDDVYGKIDFLNKVNQSLRTEFVAYQNSLNELFKKAKNQLNADFEDAKLTINEALQEQNDRTQSLQEQYSLAEKKLSENFLQVVSDLNSNMESIKKNLHQQLEQAMEEPNRAIIVMKSDLKQILSDWDDEKIALQKQSSLMEDRLAGKVEQISLGLNSRADSIRQELQQQFVQSVDKQNQSIATQQSQIQQIVSDWRNEKRLMVKKNKWFVSIVAFIVLIEILVSLYLLS
ncbi:hypothetical protein [Bacteroides sp. An269]|uniref:hypothetical protein n=1 Tax=Bacteroides sp. An269 TaxID=1965613 RepID=UPI000B398FC0|nr:hypothetical protein [Bacteroides sp. An269]OUO81707.1 hypothetical protein B5F71_05690 [Bacteroides sp. An269]